MGDRRSLESGRDAGQESGIEQAVIGGSDAAFHIPRMASGFATAFAGPLAKAKP